MACLGQLIAGPPQHARTVGESLLAVSWWHTSDVSWTVDGFTKPCGWPGAATIIITKAIASTSSPAIPVRYVALARSRLTTAVISATPFRFPVDPVPHTFTVGIGRQKIRRCSPPNVIGGLPPGRWSFQASASGAEGLRARGARTDAVRGGRAMMATMAPTFRYPDKPRPGGLIFGYATVNERVIAEGVDLLARVVGEM